MFLNANDSAVDLQPPKNSHEIQVKEGGTIDSRIVILTAEKSVQSNKIYNSYTEMVDDTWLPMSDTRIPENSVTTNSWTPNVLWSESEQRWRQTGGRFPSSIKINRKGFMNCIMGALLVCVTLSFTIIFVLNSSRSYDTSTGPRGSSPTEYTGPTLKVFGLFDNPNATAGVYFGVGLDWSLDDPPYFNNRLGYSATIQDVVFFMNETLQLKGFVNSSGFVHEQEDVFLWSAALIRGSGAIMSMTIIPQVPLDKITNDSISLLSLKCKQINEMGIPILLRFAPDMNGSWQIYGQNPALYRSAFQSLAQVVKNVTNNTAMVWSPASGLGYPFKITDVSPLPFEERYLDLDTNRDGLFDKADDPFTPYFPGEEYVDWVSMSVFYSGKYRIHPFNYRYPSDRVFLPSPVINTTVNSTLNLNYDIMVNEIAGPSSLLAGSTSLEAQLINAGTAFNFYEKFVLQMKKPFVLSSTGAAYLRGSSARPTTDELKFKQSWYSQILNQTFLEKYPLIRGLVFYNNIVNITTTTLNDTIYNPDTLVDFSFTMNNTVFDTFKKDIGKLAQSNSTSKLVLFDTRNKGGQAIVKI